MGSEPTPTKINLTDEAHYKALCEEFTALRDAALNSLLDSKCDYIECDHCGSSLNTRFCKDWNAFHDGICLVCSASLIPTHLRLKLKALQMNIEKSYNLLKGSHRESLFKDAFFSMRHLSSRAKPALDVYDRSSS